MTFTEAELEGIRELDGHNCPTCFKPIAIDRYGISPTMVGVIRELVRITDQQRRDNAQDARAVDVRKTKLTHNERSTLSKLRQHGLIAKVKAEDKKTHVAGHWLVTRKGYAFLAGEEVPARVEVYNNTVLGHPGGITTVRAVEAADKAGNDPDIKEREYIAPVEARAIADTRAPKKEQTFMATLFRSSLGDYSKGDVVEVTVDGLKFGQPVKMTKPYEITYKDITAFRADWRIAK